MSKKRIIVYLLIVVLTGIISVGISQLLGIESSLFVIIVPVVMTIMLFGVYPIAAKKNDEDKNM